MVLRLRPATEADAPAIGRISAAAFHPQTDPVARNLFPERLRPAHVSDDEVQVVWRTARKGASMKRPSAVMLVVEDDQLNHEIVGFALWDRPHSEDSKIAYGPEEFPDTLDKDAFTLTRAIVEEDQKVTFGERGAKDVWHLDYIGVDPKHMRRGIGKILLNWGIDQAVKENRDCYLIATPAGQPFYAASGFQVLRVLKIFGVDHYSMLLKHDGSKSVNSP